jgi:hypothetical protein
MDSRLTGRRGSITEFGPITLGPELPWGEIICPFGPITTPPLLLPPGFVGDDDEEDGVGDGGEEAEVIGGEVDVGVACELDVLLDGDGCAAVCVAAPLF